MKPYSILLLVLTCACSAVPHPRDVSGAGKFGYEDDITEGRPPAAANGDDVHVAKNGKDVGAPAECAENFECPEDHLCYVGKCTHRHYIEAMIKALEASKKADEHMKVTSSFHEDGMSFAPDEHTDEGSEDGVEGYEEDESIYDTALKVCTLPTGATGYIIPLEDYEDYLDENEEIEDDTGFTPEFKSFGEEYIKIEKTPTIIEVDVRTYKVILKWKVWVECRTIKPIEDAIKNVMIIFEDYDV